MEKLRSMLSARKSLVRFHHPIRLPLDPVCRVVGILAEDASLFKSALMPAKLGFRTTEEETYWVSGKGGEGRGGEARGRGERWGRRGENTWKEGVRERREECTYSSVKSFLNPCTPSFPRWCSSWVMISAKTSWFSSSSCSWIVSCAERTSTLSSHLTTSSHAQGTMV